MKAVRQISFGKLESAVDQPFGPIGALSRRYRSRQRRRPVTSRYGDAVRAMPVKPDGFLAVFPRNVMPRTKAPGGGALYLR